MTSGGRRKRFSEEPSVAPRSRTALVMDQLLSRGPELSDAATGSSGSPRGWPSVGHLLHSTSASILEVHLACLVSTTPPGDHLSSQRILAEDQARILIRALDERGEDEAIARALEEPSNLDDVPDDDNDFLTYATALRRATGGQPDESPYLALARSAAKLAAEILGNRDSSTARRHPA
jgi:hypothetical protein